jgi:hypothetical protein
MLCSIFPAVAVSGESVLVLDPVMAQYILLNGGMRYVPGSTRERHDD